MYISPYNLKSKTNNPLQFYQDLSHFTNCVIENGMPVFTKTIEEFLRFSQSKNQKTYTPEEHLLEILMSGVFWTNYQYHFSKSLHRYQLVFDKLYQWRKQFPKYKKQIDNFRGKLAYRYLTKNYRHTIPVEKRFKYMNIWLNCTKEFNQEAERLEIWNQFLHTQTKKYQQQFWEATLTFADWFISESPLYLSKYTHSWEDFMVETYTFYKKREDFIFCSRIPCEYHLNMVSAEVMNRSLKKDFEKTANKLVLLPTCMSKSPNCKAIKNIDKITCSHCTPNCQVSKITNRLNKEGIHTVLIPHSSGFSDFLKPWKDSKDTALIGVACVLNLLTGGYEMQKLNIPSQCVFLDACGCKKHWLSGKPTELNENQLYNLLIHEKIERTVNSTC